MLLRFLWRASHNILPTKENLKRRGVVTDDLCQFCCQEKKTIFHAIWECPASQDVWGVSEQAIQKCRTVGSDFLGLVGDWWRSLEEKTCSFLLWGVLSSFYGGQVCIRGPSAI